MKLIITKPGFHVKSACIWLEYHGNKMSPLMYLRKPKWLSDKVFNELVDNIDISICVKGINEDLKLLLDKK